MTTGPINPVECAQNAIRAGILITPKAEPQYLHDRETGDVFRDGLPIGAFVKTPEEAGIARFVPPPKVDRRRLPKPKQVRRYVIQKKDRPDLFK